MALTKFGFIVTGAGFDPAQHRMILRSPSFELIAVGVPAPAQALPVAQQLARDEVQLIELCGGFGPIWTSRVIEAVAGRVPIGAVGYGPESIADLAALFA
jgi:hypothetical protein